MNNVEKIKPNGIFTNYIYKAIPLAFDESMSYYETLCGVLSLLKTQEEVINNNADLLAELELYVQNYFKNLDVQTEINNKLDEMAENGTLEELIAQYVNLSSVLAYNTVADMKNATNLVNGSFVKTYGLNSLNDGGGAFYKIRNVTTSDIVDNIKIIPINDTLIAELIENNNVVCFNNVNEMKNATNLVNGSFAKTYGYYNINDGGSAFYKIRNITNDDVIDNSTIIRINDSLIAELIYTSVNVKQLGAKGDGITDDTNIFKIAINKIKNNTIEIPKAKYLITDTLNFPENTDTININGNNSELIFNINNPNLYAINLYANGTNYIKIQINDLIIVNNSNEENNINGIHLRRNTELNLFNNVRINGFYDNVITSDNWNIQINKLISIHGKNSNFNVEDGAALNNVTFINCQFKYGKNINFRLRGDAHTLLGCDISNYNNAINEFTGCGGLSIIGLYYEDNESCVNGIIIRACRGVNIVGGHFQGSGTNENYQLLNINNCFGINISGSEFRGDGNNGYILNINNGSKCNIDASDFRNISKCIYVHNSDLSINKIKTENITSFITQFNHKYARLNGIIESDQFNLCTLPHKEVVNLIFYDLIRYGNTDNRPTGLITGQTYFNTETNKLNIYNGSSWIEN